MDRHSPVLLIGGNSSRTSMKVTFFAEDDAAGERDVVGAVISVLLTLAVSGPMSIFVQKPKSVQICNADAYYICFIPRKMNHDDI